MIEETTPPGQTGVETAAVSSELILKWEHDLDRIVRSAVRQAIPKAIDDSMQRLGYSEEVAGLVHLLAARSNDAKDEVIRKALTLYGLALDALAKGNRLAILTPDDDIVSDITGFEPIRY